MKFILILVLVTATGATTLKNILKSPKETLDLYQHFKETKHLHYQPEEERLRLQLFKESAELVAELNSDDTEEAEYELNRFSVMSEEEKTKYLGFNGTEKMEEVPPTPSRLRKRSVVPDSKMWIYDGLVTKASNQGGCGACWAFAAVVALEAKYKQETGILRKFSEQELLDCTYEGKKTRARYGDEYISVWHQGCWGGWYNHCYNHIQKAGRLAAYGDYPYHGNDCACEGSAKRDSLLAAQVTGYVNVPKSEADVIEALSQNVLAVAFASTKKFHPYKRGLFKDPACKDLNANHAVAMVGYTQTYVLVKNSWGDDWGDSGFVRFKRNHDHCHIWNHAKYPLMAQTDVVDLLGEDDPVDYDPVNTDPHPDCDNYLDTRDDCDLLECEAADNGGVDWVECKRTCNHCGRIGAYTGECPAGTKRCGGVCKHEHMC